VNPALQSNALHERVRTFAQNDGSAPREDFETLALAIARFQAEHIPGYARLVEQRASKLDTLRSLPGVPTAAFRLTRVAVHPPKDDSARFVTSGTTSEERGTHAFRTTRTYEELSLRFGADALLGFGPGPRVVVSVAPVPEPVPVSSLGFMLAHFQHNWDGRPLFTRRFDPRAEERWLLRDGAIDLRNLERVGQVALDRGEPLIVLATAFALVGLLDTLGSRRIRVPERTAVMVTGGFKGKTRELSRDELYSGISHAFAIPQSHLIGEYGMTELSSQFYEGTLPGAALEAEPGVYLPPPWMRVEAVDPVTLLPVAAGELGIARIIDLANVDSAVVVQTEDLVRERGRGIELFGRRPGAPARGCSLSVEALLS
jgi:hypothetical protein